MDWVRDMSVANPDCMLAAPNPSRYMPSQLCPRAQSRVLMLSFFTMQSHGKLWQGNSKAKGVKNRMCYASARGYRYVIEVVDDKKLTVPVQYYKVYVVQHYLKYADYLVWLDYDLIVKNPHNWFEQYIDDRFDLVVTDHKNDINNGAFILRNNEWGNAFMEYWVELSSNRTKYPFTDNGGFAEAVLRFGAQNMPSDCAYTYDTCVEEMRAKYKTIKAMSGAFVKCAGRLKQRMMGPWNATTHRDLGRIRFVGTRTGFNTHGWEDWKAKSGRTKDAYFQDRMFILHNKYFDVRVAKSSIQCPSTQFAQHRTFLGSLFDQKKPQFTLLNVDKAMGREGSYMLSEFGACDLDEDGCRRQFFPLCRPRDLENVTGLNAIHRRVQLMETHVPATNGTSAIAIPRLDYSQDCRGDLLAEDETED